MNAFNQEGQTVGKQVNVSSMNTPKWFLLVHNINETGIFACNSLFFGSREEVISLFCNRFKILEEDEDWHLDGCKYFDDLEICIDKVEDGQIIF